MLIKRWTEDDDREQEVENDGGRETIVELEKEIENDTTAGSRFENERCFSD